MSEPQLWSTRFLDALDAIGFGPGRRRRGGHDVLSLSLSKSIAVALIEAPRGDPYRARIAVRAFSDADWARVRRALVGQSRYTAKLLAGELPPDIADVFASLELPLFPRTLRDIAMDCTCPDWQVPCEHLATICRRMAEMFDADPFHILEWRGQTRTALLERLASARATRAHQAENSGPQPLSKCLDSYWGTPRPLPPEESAKSNENPDLLLDQVDPPNITIDNNPLPDLLRPLYLQVTSRKHH